MEKNVNNVGNEIEIKELTFEQKLDSRISICYKAYEGYTSDMQNLVINARMHISEALEDEEAMEELKKNNNAEYNKINAVLESLNLIENNDYYDGREDVNAHLPLSEYVTKFTTDLHEVTSKAYHSVLEIWLISKIPGIRVHPDTVAFVEGYLSTKELKDYQDALINMDLLFLNKVIELYKENPSTGMETLITYVRESIMAKLTAIEVTNTIETIEKEIKEDIDEFIGKIETIEKEERASRSSSSKSSSSSNTIGNLSTPVAVGLGIVGVLAIGYIGKKIYDHFNSDDVVVIDSEGLEYSDTFNGLTSLSAFSFGDIASAMSDVGAEVVNFADIGFNYNS